MITRRNAFLAAALALAASASVSDAHADTIVAMPANGCIVDPRSAPIAQYNYGGVTFAGTSTGQITMYCAIPTTEGVLVSAMEVVYRDPDGTGSAYHISAELLKQTDLSGFVPLATLRSNLFAQTTLTQQSVDIRGSVNELLDNTYYVRVVMTRSAATANPLFRAVRLFDVLI